MDMYMQLIGTGGYRECARETLSTSRRLLTSIF